MNRRGFLKRIIAVPVMATVVPWVEKPVRAMVSTPRLNLDDLNAITLKHILPGVVDDYFKANPLMAYLQYRDKMRIRPNW